MCVNPELSDKRLRRRKLERKFRRIKRSVGDRVMSARVWTDVRPRLSAKAARRDILEDAGLLRTAQPAAPKHPLTFSTSNRLVRDAVLMRARQDAEDARQFAEKFPYARLNPA